MSIELLNLDELVTENRAVTIRGVEYPLANQTVGQMLMAMKESKKATTMSDADPENVLSKMLGLCAELLPTCPESVLHSLNITQMSALIDFASKQSVEELTEGMEPETEADPAAKGA